MSGDELVRACRMIKSPAELALMQVANDVTLAALRHVHANVKSGMDASELAAMMNSATAALGGGESDGLTLLNEASAFPHGSEKKQSVREGSIILMDFGCKVHGYRSDISRTWVFGEPSARHRKVWNTVKRGQEIALETAKIGVPVGALDMRCAPTTKRRAGGPVTSCPAFAPHGPRHRHGRTRAREPGARRRHAAAGGHVFLR